MRSIESPCTNVCQIDRKTGLCLGCGRTLDEIATWATLSADERCAIMDRLKKAQATAPERG